LFVGFGEESLQKKGDCITPDELLARIVAAAAAASIKKPEYQLRRTRRDVLSPVE
jgi:hypothetical protein